MYKIIYGVVIAVALLLTGCADGEKDQNVILVEAELLSVSLSSEVSSLEVNEMTELNANAYYNDDTTIPVSTSAEWVIGDTTVLTVDANGTLKALSAGTTSIIAKVGEVESNSISIEVIPLDTTPPTLTLNGEAELTLIQGNPYTELGATATDDRDGSVNVSTSGTVDTTTLGSYVITYIAVDNAGNSATLQRTVNVVLPPDTKAPVITLNGDTSITLFVGGAYEELGATATDDRDGVVTVTNTANVDTSIEGIYTITYTAIDKAGNEATATRTVNVEVPILAEILLEGNTTILSLGESVEFTVTGIYSDGNTEEMNDNIEFFVTPRENVDMNGSVLIAKNEGPLAIQVKVNNLVSNIFNLTIHWVVDGHVLPPEPDPAINNSTLLGIDVNDNGVRDDVERWIYKEYDKYTPCHYETYDHIMPDGSIMKGSRKVCEETSIPYHPIVRATAMQGAKAAQIIIQEPENAKETSEYLFNAVDCEISIKSLRNHRNYRGKDYEVITKLSLKEGNGLIKKLFNTTSRLRAYSEFNYHLSGEIFRMPTDEEGLDKCSDAVKSLLEELR